MYTTKTFHAGSKNWRLHIFKVVIALLACAFIAIAASEYIPAWLMGDMAMSIHLWHIAELAALLAIVLGGTLLSLLHQPQEKSVLAQFFVLSMLISTIALVPFERRAGALLIVMALFLLVYPNVRTLLRFSRQGPVSVSLLIVTLLMAWLLAPIAYREVQWQIIGMGNDVHAMELHWIGSALLMALLVLAGLLSAIRLPGWKILGIITGMAYCYLGVTAMMLQDGYAGSWSGGYGLIAVIVGGWYIIASFMGAQMLREAETAHKQAVVAVDEDESFAFSPIENESTGEDMIKSGEAPHISRTAPLPETQALLETVSR